MEEDNLLMIPHLSKELNLIGLPPLPYTLEKVGKGNSKKRHKETLKIAFNSKLMIDSLASSCFQLVNQIKSIRIHDEDNGADKINFENKKLGKQLKMCELEVEKKISEVAAAKKANQLLQEKVDQLQKKVKECQIQCENTIKKTQTNEDILKHNLKKKESDIFDLHTAIWKQFNMADKNYFPENFGILMLNQPNFSKLWSEVKYSDVESREQVLKKAVGIFQNNMKALMEENISLKMILITILQEFHDVFEFIFKKMGIPESPFLKYQIKDFMNVEEFNITAYGNILCKHFEFIKKIGYLFEKYSFHVSDDLFVCWSSIIADL